MGYDPLANAPAGTTRRLALGMALLGLGGLARPVRGAASSHSATAWPADKPTPALVLADLDGRPWTLASMRGQVVVLNFWATWCAPCRTEMPSLQKLQATRRGQGLAVVTVNYKEAVAEIGRFLKSPFDLPVLLDRDGAAAGAWTPRVFPTTVLVDREGNARTVVVGGFDWTGAEATRLLDPLLAAARS